MFLLDSKYIYYNLTQGELQVAGRPKKEGSPERLAYQRSQCQARYLNQPWSEEFTFEEWWRCWQPHWPRRGRGARDFCMIRQDQDLPWHQDNVDICERLEYLQPEGRYWRNRRWGGNT